MTDPLHEASDVDRAEQALSADERADDRPVGGFPLESEADPADQYEQHQGVPGSEDDYDR